MHYDNADLTKSFRYFAGFACVALALFSNEEPAQMSKTSPNLPTLDELTRANPGWFDEAVNAETAGKLTGGRPARWRPGDHVAAARAL